jgi:hypothetical protein
MGHDPIQCTRAYLNLWKIADRLFPESRWLEVGEIPDSELHKNAQALSTATLSWCDTPDELRDYAKKVLALRIDDGATAEADKLRSKLMDRALSYAEQLNLTVPSGHILSRGPLITKVMHHQSSPLTYTN